jgi:hypothetical protein
VGSQCGVLLITQHVSLDVVLMGKTNFKSEEQTFLPAGAFEDANGRSLLWGNKKRRQEKLWITEGKTGEK